MNTQHRGPLSACLVLTVVCGLFLGNALRTQGVIDVITATERYASHAAVAVPIRLDLDLAGQDGAPGRAAPAPAAPPAPATAPVIRPVRVTPPVMASRPVHVQRTTGQGSRPTAPVRHTATRVARGHQKARHRAEPKAQPKAREQAASPTRTATRTVARIVVATRTVATRIAAPAPVKVHGLGNGHQSQSGKAHGSGKAQGKSRGHGSSRGHGAARGHRKHH